MVGFNKILVPSLNASNLAWCHEVTAETCYYATSHKQIETLFRIKSSVYAKAPWKRMHFSSLSNGLNEDISYNVNKNNSGDEESEKILFRENIWWRSQCYKSLYRELSWCFSGLTWVTDSATGIFLHQRRSGKWVSKLFFVERLKKRAQIKFLDYDATLQHSTIFILALKMMMFCIPAFLLSSNFVH